MFIKDEAKIASSKDDAEGGRERVTTDEERVLRMKCHAPSWNHAEMNATWHDSTVPSCQLSLDRLEMRQSGVILRGLGVLTPHFWSGERTPTLRVYQ